MKNYKEDDEKSEKVILIFLVSIFRVKQSYLGNFKWFISYTQKCMKSGKKTDFTRNAINSKLMKIFGQNFI